jgi:hypothetical protein
MMPLTTTFLLAPCVIIELLMVALKGKETSKTVKELNFLIKRVDIEPLLRRAKEQLYPTPIQRECEFLVVAP